MALILNTTNTTNTSAPVVVDEPTPSSTLDSPKEQGSDSVAKPTPPKPPVIGSPIVDIPLPGGSSPEPGAPGVGGPLPGGASPELGDPAPPGGIALGQTIDGLGRPHVLVLNVAAGIQETLQQALQQTNQLFAVVSGSTKFTITGDAAVGAWRFVVDSSATGTAAPIVVIKHTTALTLVDLAANPTLFFEPSALNEDVAGTSARLSALIADVTSTADPLYADLSDKLQDPTWTGALIFNASVSVPDEVLGQSTGALADTQVAAFSIGFDTSRLVGSPTATESLIGIVDYMPPSGVALPTLRARFGNSALVSFEMV